MVFMARSFSFPGHTSSVRDPLGFSGERVRRLSGWQRTARSEDNSGESAFLAGKKGLPVPDSGAEVFSKPQAGNLPGLFFLLGKILVVDGREGKKMFWDFL